jgi:hypothetical protein
LAEGSEGPPDLNQEIGGTRPVVFEADRDELLALIERLCSHPLDHRPHNTLCSEP